MEHFTYPKESQMPAELLALAELYKTDAAIGKSITKLETTLEKSAEKDEKTNYPRNPFTPSDTVPGLEENVAIQALREKQEKIREQIKSVEGASAIAGRERWKQLVRAVREYTALEQSLPESMPSEAFLQKQLARINQEILTLYNAEGGGTELYNKIQKLSHEELIASTDTDIRHLRSLFEKRDKIEQKIKDISTRKQTQSTLEESAGIAREVVEDQRQDNEKTIRAKMKEMRENNFDLEVFLRIRELREFARAAQHEEIPNTNSIQKMTREIIFLSTKMGEPVLLQGDTGTGKTSILKKIAREHLSEPAVLRFLSETDLTPGTPEWQQGFEQAKTPYMISGHARFEPHEMLGMMQLVANKHTEPEEQMDAINTLVNEWIKEHPDATEEDKKKIEDLAREFITENKTKTEFALGPLYRAMKEGKPFIIDEMNAIPHSVLIILNDAITRKPGDTVPVQGAPGEFITVQEGFCILASGNFGDKYNDLRQNMDIALMNRFVNIDYGYLPQFYPVGDETFALKDHASSNNELFITMIAMHMRDGKTFTDTFNPHINGYELLDALWRASMAIKELQDITERKHPNGVQYDIQAPSMRDIIRIMEHMHENEDSQRTAYDFERALYRMYISQEENKHKQYLLFEHFKKYNLFDTWTIEGNGDIGITKVTAPDRPKQTAPQRIVPEEVLAFATGGPLPEYKMAIENNHNDTPLTPNEVASIMQIKTDMENQLAELRKMEESATGDRKTKLQESIKNIEELLEKFQQSHN